MPTSSRLCLLQFYLFEEEYKDAIGPLVTQLIQKDKGEAVPDYIPPAKRRKKLKHTSSHIVCLTSNQMWKMADEMDMSEYYNHASQDRSLYTKFTKQILNERNIKWRFHDKSTDICMINDVDRDSGVIKQNSFVHVTYTRDKSEEILLTCTSDIFKFIQSTAHQDNPIWPVEDIVPHTSFTCPHCQFFKDHLLNVYTTVLSQPFENLPPALEMVKKSLGYINEPYVLMGNVHSNSTTKLSIKGFEEDTYSTVKVTFEYGKCVVTYTNGMCSVQMHNRKKVPKSSKVTNLESHCLHVCTFALHIDAIQSYFPEYFGQDIDVFEGNTGHDSSEDTQQLDPQQQYGQEENEGNFDIKTGLWTFPSLTTFKPKEMMDPQLIQHTKTLLMKAIQDSTIELKPNPLDQNNTLKNCDCGAGYPNNTEYTLKGHSTLHTRIGPVCCAHYNLHV